MTESKGLLSDLGVQERARLVVALDHDVRQPQHVIAMGLRRIRGTIADLELLSSDSDSLSELVLRLKAELAALQIGVRQVVDAQQDLVDAFRLEVDGSQPALSACSAGDIIGRAVTTNRLLAGAIEVRGVVCALEFISDPRWVERILNNLLANAICHSGASRILVGARKRAAGIEFEVRDNGAGIEQERLERIFAPYKAPTVTPIGRSSAKSGLGLYNVRLFCERLGGEVSCRSRPNEGTTFRVRLPGPVERCPEKGRSVQQAPIRAASVAILMNDESALRALSRKLEALGIDVYADHDSIRWLSIVTDMQRPPDLILLDARPRGTSAMQQLDIVRRRWPGNDVRAIVLADRAAEDPTLSDLPLVPVLRRPISEKGIELIVDLLARNAAFPRPGLLSFS